MVSCSQMLQHVEPQVQTPAADVSVSSGSQRRRDDDSVLLTERLVGVSCVQQLRSEIYQLLQTFTHCL